MEQSNKNRYLEHELNPKMIKYIKHITNTEGIITSCANVISSVLSDSILNIYKNGELYSGQNNDIITEFTKLLNDEWKKIIPNIVLNLMMFGICPLLVDKNTYGNYILQIPDPDIYVFKTFMHPIEHKQIYKMYYKLSEFGQRFKSKKKFFPLRYFNENYIPYDYNDINLLEDQNIINNQYSNNTFMYENNNNHNNNNFKKKKSEKKKQNTKRTKFSTKQNKIGSSYENVIRIGGKFINNYYLDQMGGFKEEKDFFLIKQDPYNPSIDGNMRSLVAKISNIISLLSSTTKSYVVNNKRMANPPLIVKEKDIPPENISTLNNFVPTFYENINEEHKNKTLSDYDTINKIRSTINSEIHANTYDPSTFHTDQYRSEEYHNIYGKKCYPLYGEENFIEIKPNNELVSMKQSSASIDIINVTDRLHNIIFNTLGVPSGILTGDGDKYQTFHNKDSRNSLFLKTINKYAELIATSFTKIFNALYNINIQKNNIIDIKIQSPDDMNDKNNVDIITENNNNDNNSYLNNTNNNDNKNFSSIQQNNTDKNAHIDEDVNNINNTYINEIELRFTVPTINKEYETVEKIYNANIIEWDEFKDLVANQFSLNISKKKSKKATHNIKKISETNLKRIEIIDKLYSAGILKKEPYITEYSKILDLDISNFNLDDSNTITDNNIPITTFSNTNNNINNDTTNENNVKNNDFINDDINNANSNNVKNDTNIENKSKINNDNNIEKKKGEKRKQNITETMVSNKQKKIQNYGTKETMIDNNINNVDSNTNTKEKSNKEKK